MSQRVSRRRFLVLAGVASVAAVGALVAGDEILNYKSKTQVPITPSTTAVSTGTTSPIKTTVEASTTTPSVTSVSTSTTTLSAVDTLSADYMTFIAPYLNLVEGVRQRLMEPEQFGTPPSGNLGNVTMGGYDPTFPSPSPDIPQGNWRGETWHIPPNPDTTHETNDWAKGTWDGFALIDSGLWGAHTFDYLNSLKGITTAVEINNRAWLAQQFVNPATGANNTYTGMDRREVLFGTSSPWYGTANWPPSEVYDGATGEGGSIGQCWYIPNYRILGWDLATNTENDYNSNPFPAIVTELDNIPVDFSNLNTNMEDTIAAMAIAILTGGSFKGYTVSQFYDYLVSGWTSQKLPNGTYGGYFTAAIDPYSTKKGSASTRALTGFIIGTRMCGLWQSNSNALTVSQEVENQLWWPNTSTGQLGFGAVIEGNAQALLAHDPRLPSWFQ